jgi:hypothetical protein
MCIDGICNSCQVTTARSKHHLQQQLKVCRICNSDTVNKRHLHQQQYKTVPETAQTMHNSSYNYAAPATATPYIQVLDSYNSNSMHNLQQQLLVSATATAAFSIPELQ